MRLLTLKHGLWRIVTNIGAKAAAVDTLPALSCPYYSFPSKPSYPERQGCRSKRHFHEFTKVAKITIKIDINLIGIWPLISFQFRPRLPPAWGPKSGLRQLLEVEGGGEGGATLSQSLPGLYRPTCQHVTMSLWIWMCRILLIQLWNFDMPLNDSLYHIKLLPDPTIKLIQATFLTFYTNNLSTFSFLVFAASNSWWIYQ